MSDFFNDYFNIKKIMEEKREYKKQVARIKALPEEYQYVFDKIQGYMFGLAGGSGYDIMKIHFELLDLFETAVAEGKHVLEVTGNNVAAFCDELLRNAQTWTENRREKLNSDIMKKFKKENDLK
ncbi:MAG: DUF1048 domain-containing protein [Oscillospiraceae bacterium]|nr:DUF1048 domain-containing protein [Oscillospiraceae bacterium]